MIEAVYREGQIHPLDPVPREWVDGQSLQISPDTTGSVRAEQFDRLAKAWKEDTRYISSTTDLATHPAYQRLSSHESAIARLQLHCLGYDVDIEHDLRGLEGPVYGHVVQVLRRPAKPLA